MVNAVKLILSSPKLSFIVGYEKEDNLGDLLINKILMERVKQKGNLIIRNLSPSLKTVYAENSASGYCYVSRYVFGLFVFLRAFSGCLSKKRTYLFLQPGHTYTRNSLTSLKRLVRLGLLKLVKFFGVKIVRVGVSIGPFSKVDSFIERHLAKSMYFYSVRDQESKEYGELIGIKNIEYFPDLAFLLPFKPALNKKQFEFNGIFSFRDSTLMNDSREIYKKMLFPALLTVASDLKEKQGKLLVSFQVTEDSSSMSEIHEFLKSNNIENSFLREKVNLADYQAVYASTDFIISNRLHVLLLGMATGALGIPLIDRSKHTKISGIFTEAKLENLILDISEPTKIAAKLEDILAQREEYLRLIKHHFQAKRIEGEALFNKLFI